MPNSCTGNDVKTLIEQSKRNNLVSLMHKYRDKDRELLDFMLFRKRSVRYTL